MKTFFYLSKVPLWQKGLALSLLMILVILIALPHRIKELESRATLQNGKKIEVQITLQSPWSWLSPSKIIKIKVLLDGRELLVDERAYKNGGKVDGDRAPVIAERNGFPVITLGGPLVNTEFIFLNYQFSEMRVSQSGNTVSSFFQSNLNSQTFNTVIRLEPIPSITIGTSSIKKITLEQLRELKK